MTQIIHRDKEILEDPLSDEQRVRLWCKIMRLNSIEGLEYMKKHGYKIKKDRYYQLMTEINKILPKRLLYEARQGFIDQHFNSIDTLENSMQIINADLRHLENDHSFKAILIKERLHRIREEILALMSAYREKTQYVMSKQMENRKLVRDGEQPTTTSIESMKLTKELAVELGVDNYDEIVAADAASHDKNSDNANNLTSNDG